MPYTRLKYSTLSIMPLWYSSNVCCVYACRVRHHAIAPIKANLWHCLAKRCSNPRHHIPQHVFQANAGMSVTVTYSLCLLALTSVAVRVVSVGSLIVPYARPQENSISFQLVLKPCKQCIASNIRTKHIKQRFIRCPCVVCQRTIQPFLAARIH